MQNAYWISMEVEGSEDKELLLKDLCASQPVFQWRLKDQCILCLTRFSAKVSTRVSMEVEGSL